MADIVPPEFTESNAIGRIDSGETDESPFASNLVTPADEEGHHSHGIHQRIDIANSLLGYFASRDSVGGNEKCKIPLSDDIELKPNCDTLPEVNEKDQNNIPKTSIMESLPSVQSSLSSSESIPQLAIAGIYTLPNDHIDEDEMKVNHEDNHEDATEENYIPQQRINMDLSGRYIMDALCDSSFDLVCLVLRITCFLPWCIAVGGFLVFAPRSIEGLAFGTGYLEHLTGLKRYSHWATHGFQHITCFFAFIGAMTWFFPMIGYLAIGALAAQFCFEWHNFLEDTTIPLGEDDQQTVYSLARTTWWNHDVICNIRKVNDKFYLTNDSIPTMEQDDD